MSAGLVELCWTAVSSKLGLISSTFALYQILELELLEYFKSARTLVSPSQVYMFRSTVSNDQKFENTLLVNITRRSDDVRPIGGAVLDSCFVQVRTHQQHFCSLPVFRVGALQVLQKYLHAS